VGVPKWDGANFFGKGKGDLWAHSEGGLFERHRGSSSAFAWSHSETRVGGIGLRDLLDGYWI